MKDVHVITGAGGGIGFAIAEGFTDGIVLLADISKDALEVSKKELEQKGIEAYVQIVDLSDTRSIEKMLLRAQELGAVKTIVNSAGVSGDQAPPKVLFKINLLGTQHLLMKALDVLDSGAHVILISSMMGHSVLDDDSYLKFLRYPESEGALDKLVEVVNDDSTLAYNFSKKGVLELVKRYAYEYGKKGVRINSVSPGIIATAMSKQAEVEHPEQMEQLKLMTPMSRMGTVEDIANTVMFLASDKAHFITGTDILVDGGLIVKIIENTK